MRQSDAPAVAYGLAAITAIAARFQEHDEDIIENHLLLAATTLRRRAGTRDATARRMLHRIADLLQNVELVYFPPPPFPR